VYQIGDVYVFLALHHGVVGQVDLEILGVKSTVGLGVSLLVVKLTAAGSLVLLAPEQVDDITDREGHKCDEANRR
jgi:hypothetical protein